MEYCVSYVEWSAINFTWIWISTILGEVSQKREKTPTPSSKIEYLLSYFHIKKRFKLAFCFLQN